MKDTVNIYFNVAKIVALVFGIILCITIVGAILGVPLIIASKRFEAAQVMTDDQLVQNRSNLLGWGIFLSIILAPTVVGLIVMLVFVLMVDSYIKNIEQGVPEKNSKSFSDTVTEGATSAWNNVKETFKGNPSEGKKASEKSDLDQKAAELEKLDKMKLDGLLTDEEYLALRKKILGL